MEPPRTRTASPLKTAAVVIYATLALLWLTIPQSMTNWLQGLNPNPIQQTLFAGAQAIRGAVQAVHADVPYRHARALFLRLTHKDED